MSTLQWPRQSEDEKGDRGDTTHRRPRARVEEQKTGPQQCRDKAQEHVPSVRLRRPPKAKAYADEEHEQGDHLLSTGSHGIKIFSPLRFDR